jgi:hypothetical protein
MFNWYRRAEICYAYLFGLKSREDFCKSRWFTRGWTLQELLAPADVLFFDDSWVQIGFKTSLSSFIALGTGINERALRNGGNFEDFSFAEKMSWAADRRTTSGESVKLRNMNLDKFGCIWKDHSSQDAWRFIQSSKNDFPHIEFSDHQVKTGTSRLRRSLEVFDGQQLACTLHVIADAFESTENQAHRPQTRTEQGPHIIAVDRGNTTVIGLNNEYDLRLRTQLQWKRMERDMHTENLKRQCLLMISIVPRSSLT